MIAEFYRLERQQLAHAASQQLRRKAMVNERYCPHGAVLVGDSDGCFKCGVESRGAQVQNLHSKAQQLEKELAEAKDANLDQIVRQQEEILRLTQSNDAMRKLLLEAIQVLQENDCHNSAARFEAAIQKDRP